MAQQATKLETFTYDPAIFEVRNLQEAKHIILNPTDSLTTDARWITETPYLVKLIQTHFPKLKPDSLVLDYGCGIGRIVSELIIQNGCRGVGVDISTTMRALAASYVDSPRFAVIPSGMADLLEGKCDFAISVWALQHMAQPTKDIEAIKKCLKPGGLLLVVNDNKRWIPTAEIGFIHDDKDIRALLQGTFEETDEIPLDPASIGDYFALRSWCGVFQKNG